MIDTDRPVEGGRAGPGGFAACDGGYVMVMSILLLVPLVVFAALVVDVGAWFVEGQRAQRAADAGALAGVVWLPDETTGRSTALTTVQLNGYPTATLAPSRAAFDAAPTGAAPVVLAEPTATNELEVSVKARGAGYLGRVIGLDEITIARSATSRFVEPLTMGNPDSTLGGGVDGADPANYWLNILPESRPRAHGDLISSINGRNGPNPNHDPDGYLFVVDVPAAAAGSSRLLQVRTSCFLPNNAGTGTFTLYGPDATPYTDYDNVNPSNLVTSRDIGRADNPTPCDWTTSADSATWHTIHDVGGQAGRWVLQARHQGTSVRVLYSIRVVDGSDNTCVGTAPDCVTVSALNWLGAFTNSGMFDAGGGTETEIYLAEIDRRYADNTLEILLFDPADGIDAVKVKDANDNFVDFTWDTVDIARFGYTNGNYTTDQGPFDQRCGGHSAVTSPSGGNCNPTSGQRNWFQDRTVRIRVPITSNPCNGTWCWWKLVYINDTNDTNETLTFRASVVGDPVRLTR